MGVAFAKARDIALEKRSYYYCTITDIGNVTGSPQNWFVFVGKLRRSNSRQPPPIVAFYHFPWGQSYFSRDIEILQHHPKTLNSLVFDIEPNKSVGIVQLTSAQIPNNMDTMDLSIVNNGEGYALPPDMNAKEPPAPSLAQLVLDDVRTLMDIDNAIRVFAQLKVDSRAVVNCYTDTVGVRKATYARILENLDSIIRIEKHREEHALTGTGSSSSTSAKPMESITHAFTSSAAQH